MRLYDHIIEDTQALLKPLAGTAFSYQPSKCWPCSESSELVMLSESAYELGGSGKASVNYTCVTTSPDIVSRDEIVVFGEDLKNLRGDVSFARITFVETEELEDDADQEALYHAIRTVDFVRYHVFPEGYMVRVSTESDREQVRISKRAVKKGIGFEAIGNAYIRKYHELPFVRKVRVCFLVNQPVIDQLAAYAGKVDDITKTLTHILDGMPTDCGHCSMKPVCDEVEGMRELHLGKKK